MGMVYLLLPFLDSKFPLSYYAQLRSQDEDPEPRRAGAGAARPARRRSDAPAKVPVEDGRYVTWKDGYGRLWGFIALNTGCDAFRFLALFCAPLANHCRCRTTVVGI